MSQSVDISQYKNNFTFRNKLYRILWKTLGLFLFRPFSLRIFKKYRNFILRMFGAKIGPNSVIHSSVKIWAPSNLSVGDYTCIGQQADLYNQGKITIGDNTTISQKAYICASSHDISDPKIELILCPIEIADQVWIAADAFIGPGVTIGQGAVVGARSAVFKDVEPWAVVGGNPAKFIKKRELKA